jgi:UDP-glucose 4-epimerase
MNEDHPLRPTTPYAAGKLAADLLLNSYVTLFPIKILTIRPFNNYGPRQNKTNYAGVIPLTIKRILDKQAPIVEGTGEQTRDFIYVEDTVRHTLQLCATEAAWGKTINLASGREVHIRELIEAICKAMGYHGQTETRPPRPGDHSRHLGGTELAKSLISFEPLTDLPAGIASTVAWYQRRHTKSPHPDRAG